MLCYSGLLIQHHTCRCKQKDIFHLLLVALFKLVLMKWNVSVKIYTITKKDLILHVKSEAV